jgi:hypothetical protein
VLLGVVAKVPRPSLRWTRLAGPFFGNAIAELSYSGRGAETWLRTSAPLEDAAQLIEVDRRRLAG